MIHRGAARSDDGGHPAHEVIERQVTEISIIILRSDMVRGIEAVGVSWAFKLVCAPRGGGLARRPWRRTSWT